MGKSVDAIADMLCIYLLPICWHLCRIIDCHTLTVLCFVIFFQYICASCVVTRIAAPLTVA